MAIAEASPLPASMTPELVELRQRRRDSALSQLVSAAESSRHVSEPLVVLAALQRTHRLMGGAAARGFVVAHARSVALAGPAFLLGRSVRGVDWSAEDGSVVHLAALLLSPASLPAAAHVERVAAVMHLLRLQRTRQRVLEAEPAQVAALLQAGAS
jgi:mannitol/fructose-specific phosphotransferase system IIA component (Ntr-type)